MNTTQSVVDTALQVIPTLAYTATSVGLLFALLAFRQNRRSHNAGLTKQFFDEWFGADLAAARSVLRSGDFQRALAEKHQDIHHFTQSLGEVDAGHLRSLLSFFDRVGWFAAADHLDADHILGPMHHIVASLGKQLVPLIEASGAHPLNERSLTESPIYYAGFRWLYLRTLSKKRSQTRLLKRNFRHPSLFGTRDAWKTWQDLIETRARDLSVALEQPFVERTYEADVASVPDFVSGDWITVADAWPGRFRPSDVLTEVAAAPFAYRPELLALIRSTVTSTPDGPVVRITHVRKSGGVTSPQLKLTGARDTYRKFLATNGQPDTSLPGAEATVRQRFLADVEKPTTRPMLCGALGVNLTVVSSDGEVLLLRRSATCPLWPGRWTTAVGETVDPNADRRARGSLADGAGRSDPSHHSDGAIDAGATAVRGAREELGLVIAAEDVRFLSLGRSHLYGDAALLGLLLAPYNMDAIIDSWRRARDRDENMYGLRLPWTEQGLMRLLAGRTHPAELTAHFVGTSLGSQPAEDALGIAKREWVPAAHRCLLVSLLHYFGTARVGRDDRLSQAI